MKVWKLDDCDYVAGEALEDVLRWYEAETGIDASGKTDELAEPPEEVSLDETMLTEESRDVPGCEEITYAEGIRRAQAAGESFPMILATDAHYV